MRTLKDGDGFIGDALQRRAGEDVLQMVRILSGYRRGKAQTARLQAKYETGVQWLLADDLVSEGPLGWREAHSTYGMPYVWSPEWHFNSTHRQEIMGMSHDLNSLKLLNYLYVR